MRPRAPSTRQLPLRRTVLSGVELEGVLDDPAPSAPLTTLGDSAMSFNARVWINPQETGAGGQPTLPSSEIATSFCASTANSIGSSCSTSLQKPLTMSAVASSSSRPRCMQ